MQRPSRGQAEARQRPSRSRLQDCNPAASTRLVSLSFRRRRRRRRRRYRYRSSCRYLHDDPPCFSMGGFMYVFCLFFSDWSHPPHPPHPPPSQVSACPPDQFSAAQGKAGRQTHRPPSTSRQSFVLPSCALHHVDRGIQVSRYRGIQVPYSSVLCGARGKKKKKGKWCVISKVIRHCPITRVSTPHGVQKQGPPLILVLVSSTPEVVKQPLIYMLAVLIIFRRIHNP